MFLIDFCSHPINVRVLLISCMEFVVQATSHYFIVWSEDQSHSVSVFLTLNSVLSMLVC